MTTTVDIVLGGLSLGGEIRDPGERIEINGNMPVSPQEQEDRWGKIFYVEVGSKFDDPKLRSMLGKQEGNLLQATQLDVNPQLTPQGKSILGEEDAEDQGVLDRIDQQIAADEIKASAAPKDYFKSTSDSSEESQQDDGIPQGQAINEDEEESTPNISRDAIMAMRRTALEELVEARSLEIPATKAKKVSTLKKAIIEELGL